MIFLQLSAIMWIKNSNLKLVFVSHTASNLTLLERNDKLLHFSHLKLCLRVIEEKEEKLNMLYSYIDHRKSNYLSLCVIISRLCVIIVIVVIR